MTRPPTRRCRAAATAVLGSALLAACTHAHPNTAGPPNPASSTLAGPTAASSPPAPTSPSPPAVLPPDASEVAAGFVTALNTHDARPGHDRGLHQANTRTRPYVSDHVYAAIADPQTRDAATLWAAMLQAQATTSVHVDKVAAADGAPAPTPKRAEVRVTYTVTTTGRGLRTTQTLSQGMQLRATAAGWRVDQLLTF